MGMEKWSMWLVHLFIFILATGLGSLLGPSLSFLPWAPQFTGVIVFGVIEAFVTLMK